MKQLLLICAVALVVGCKYKSPTVEIADPILEKAIRKELNKQEGELTKADLENVTVLNLDFNKLTSVKGLENFTQLQELSLYDNNLTDLSGLEKLTKLNRLSLSFNPDLTKAQIDQLQKALPNCKIYSNPTR